MKWLRKFLKRKRKPAEDPTIIFYDDDGFIVCSRCRNEFENSVTPDVLRRVIERHAKTHNATHIIIMPTFGMRMEATNGETDSRA